ncbi:MAG: outer membrane beta-barrel protein [Lewinellaceae bacterium]|nr:outer membrane beta-barrel protein [Saprospiraceae bacterium]MCB9329927.1 outer membrane beta-barrel protein [Lewinellaceae bacterium]
MEANPFVRHICVLFLFLSGTSSLLAQHQVSGTITDAAGKPLSYANALLLAASDSSLVHGVFTSEAGGYVFKNIPSGTYMLRFSMLGFLGTTTDPFSLEGNKLIGTVVLEENTTAIREVEVTAKRPFLEQKIDRVVVNVANSITNAGGNALEVLQRSPGVQVNKLTKSISLAGKDGVMVMINDKIQRLPIDAVVDMLSGMNADNIDHIELIHTPPSNFEASGNAGIINIVLKKSGDEGLNGGYSAKAGYGRGGKYGAGLYFNYRKNKINWFGNYDYDFNLNPQVFTNYRSILQGNDLLETDTYSDRPHTPTRTQNARIGADFQVGPKTVIGVLGTFFDRNWYMEALNTTTYSRNRAVESRLVMPNTETNHNQSFAGNVNLAHTFPKKQTFNLDLDYIRYDMKNPTYYELTEQDAAGNPTEHRELRFNKKTPIGIAVAKADYSFPTGNIGKIETGGKFTSLVFDNDVRLESRETQQDWIVDPEFTALFRLREKVAGVYATFSGKLGTQIDLKAGIRYEYTDTNLGSDEEPDVVDRQYGSWFPTLFITRKLSETQSLNFSYSRRISRPTIRQLAPWLIFSDPSTIQTGNPAIQPAFTNALNLNYTIRSMHMGLSYSLTNEPMRYVARVDPVTNRQLNLQDNLDNEKVAGVNVFFPLHPTAWWEVSNNVFTNYREINFKLEDLPIRVHNMEYGFNSTHSFNLTNGFTLEVSGNFNSPGYWGTAYWKATGSLDIGIEKKLGNEWGKLRFAATDLFQSTNWFGTIDQAEVNSYVRYSYQFAERVFMLSWTNTFGNKKVQSARKRRTGGEEELQRI